MKSRATANAAGLDFYQIKMLANFGDAAVDYPRLSFEEIAMRLGVDFDKAQNGKAWEKECRDVFEIERSGSK
jgi:hypothetical protein